MSDIRQGPAIDIEFQNLNYAVKTRGKRSILKSISGRFCSGELTAILGASGAGKTALLNILAGYISKGVTGSIQINGTPRDMKIFHKVSTYIMQENLLQPRLSVEELMMTAARLKLANHISMQQKRTIVMEIINLLGLRNCLETWTEKLSGGQQKRLSIALEMVSNPPVIFLDEPTSGLDTVSINQCIKVLKNLTRQGRNVICSIHQPSDLTFQNFNQVYFIHEGMCVYNGSTSNLVPFMFSLGYECPVNYSPADYIIETVQTIKESAPVLAHAIKNGKLNMRESQTINGKNNSRYHTVIYDEIEKREDINLLNIDFPTSSWSQFYVIISRMMLQLRRNKLLIGIQLMTVLVTSSLISMLFYKVGNNPSLSISNFKYCVCLLIYFVFVCLMSTVLLYPPEVELLKREYFNRWYGLKSYFFALTLRNLPVVVICAAIIITSTYLFTDQPLEFDRFIRFTIAGLLTAFTAEGLGLAIGSVCSITIGSVVASALGCVFILFCFFGVGAGQSSYINFEMTMVMYISFLRCSLVALILAVLGDRRPLECTDEIYCYFQDPKVILKEAGMLNASYSLHILGLIIHLIFFRIIAFVLLRCRLSSEFSSTFIVYVNKFLPNKK